MPKIRRTSYLLAVVLSALVAGPALAKHHAHPKLKVKGPGSVKLGKGYSVTVKGKGTKKANFVVAWEYVSGVCKSTYAAEFAYLGNPTSAPISQSVSGKFKIKHSFTAGHVGTANLCAYLINKTSTTTYKTASTTWTEHA